MADVNATDANWQDEVISADRPVLVDVWAPWCGPCKMVGPALERIHAENTDRFKLVMANMEEFEKTAEQLEIRATPTLMIFKGGELVAKKSGAMMQSQIKQWLDQNI
ncbi:thioredoxin [Sessilibacter sp. MAH2]